MKLTKYQREAFVRAVLADVPQVDHAEKIRNEHRKLVEKHLPKPLVAAMADPIAARFVRHNNYVVGSYGLDSAVSLGLFPSTEGKARYQSEGDWHPLVPQSDQVRLVEMVKAKVAADAELKRLRVMLEGVAASKSTSKGLAEALPEFAKYLPPDQPATSRTVPALANVVSEFSKAGWPAGKKR
jgi:hypothetical protein